MKRCESFREVLTGRRASLTHARALVTKDEEDYTDDPEKGIYWGPPSLDRPHRPIRWSRKWYDWRDAA